MEAVTAAANILRQRARERSARLTELGNSERFASAHGERYRYVKPWGKWLVWDGRRWRRDEIGSEIAAAKDVVRALYEEASLAAKLAANGDEQAGARAKALAQWANTSARANAIAAMLKLAQSEDPIAATPEMFDRDRFTLNVSNGRLDLRSGTLHPHRPDDMLTMLAPVDYDPTAACPLWDAFLARVLPDPEVRVWLQRFAGYCLTGDVGEQLLAFLLGMGANGKSVFLDVLLAIVGDYGLRAAPDLVLAKHGEAHPTELADLEGKRVVVCSEIEQGRAWAEGTIKRITGDTTLTARRMRQDFYTFEATHTMIIAANTKPTVRGTDHAIWRRMRLVPFDVTIPPAERDKGLVARLLEESPGILAWAVRGCLDWQRNGLGEAKAIDAATEVYRADQDTLGHWIEESCVLLSDAFTPMGTLYESYSAWCAATGREAWTRETVRARLLERSGLDDRRTKVARGIQGIGLRSNRHLEVVR
jgi:putative DNA primase/helicase